MKFLIDSCLSKFAVEALRHKNYDTIWIAEDKKDPGDDIILKRAFEEDRILITADKDFGELVFVFRQPHPSIIRLVNIRAKEQGEMILQIVEKYQHEFINNPLITVEKTQIRIKYTEDKEN